MSDLISRCELFNRLATVPAPSEANDFKAEVYKIIQSMEPKKVLYICNRKKCDDCFPECDLTSDPRFAASDRIVVVDYCNYSANGRDSVMILDDAIRHAERIADSYKDTEPTCKSALEHRQLAEWLKDLKTYRMCIKSRSFWDAKHCDECRFIERCPFDDDVDEPKTDCLTCRYNSDEWDSPKCEGCSKAYSNYEPQADCDHKCIQTEIGCERAECPRR